MNPEQVISLAGNKIKENLQRRRQKKENRLKQKLLEPPGENLLNFDEEIQKGLVDNLESLQM